MFVMTRQMCAGGIRRVLMNLGREKKKKKNRDMHSLTQKWRSV